VALAGVLVSVALGVLLALVADQTAILGIVVGGVGTVVSLQLGVMVQLRRRAEHEDQTSRLLGSAEKVPSLLRDLTDIAEAASQALAEDRWPIYREAAESELSQAKTHLQGLARGQIEVPSGETRALRSMVQAVQRRIVTATVFPGQYDFWKSEAGKEYLKLTRELTRGASPVEVTRIFIVDEAATRELGLEGELESVLAEQLDAGVEVWRVDAAKLDRELYTPVVVIDNAVVQEMVANANGEAIRYRYSTNPADVDRARGQLRAILGSAASTRLSAAHAPATVLADARGEAAGPRAPEAA
jgi:hypothetical protein